MVNLQSKPLTTFVASSSHFISTY